MTITHLLTLSVSPLTWLAMGLLFMGSSLVIPNPVTAAMGLAGLVTALVALSMPVLAKQLLIWGILTGAFLLIFYGLVPRQSAALAPLPSANILTSIPAGGVGQVSYSGVQWNARCQISDVTLGQGQTVSVVGREGNTLIVLPDLPEKDHNIGKNG